MTWLAAPVNGMFRWVGDRIGVVSNRTYRLAEKLDYLSARIYHIQFDSGRTSKSAIGAPPIAHRDSESDSIAPTPEVPQASPAAHDVAECVSSRFPIVEQCAAPIVLTDEERAVIDGTIGGAHPSQPIDKCDLASGHRGPHYCLVQGGIDDHELWLTWDQNGLRGFRQEEFCLLDLPLAQSRDSETAGCRLFAGHPGPHAIQSSTPNLWWWGTTIAGTQRGST